MKLHIFFILLLFTIGNAKAGETDSLWIQRQDTAELSSEQMVIHFLQESGIPITYGNKVKLLTSGREKFNDLFEAIRGAKHHIHLEYFNFRNDSIANALFDLLAEKVKEGVEVRALFDAFGNWSNNKPLKKRHLKAIRERGIEIVKFDPFKFPYINHAAHRDHRKIVVIDGRIGYTGGMNIADYYINGLPKIGTWRDMHIRIEGPAVDILQEIFLTIWNKTTKQNITGEVYFPERTAPADSTDGITVAIVDRTPKKDPRMLSHTYAMSIYAAKENVRIVNPYFVPTSSIRKALNHALKKGTKVEIMISSKSDIPFTPDASLYKVHKLMKRGADIYLYNGGFHHSKIMMVDETFCTVGTANLNSRSLRYDYETNAFIFNKEFTAQLDSVFQADTQHCTRLTPEVWKQRSPWKKFVGWFANLFTPFL
ncbi:cardiolipin synthase [Bacteroides salyersiae]|uniref:cardiolipin synthase n=1 Tax=Bacteroides salyersiae TaxID=291644 RepID=UPI001C393A39|nr:cardiolipin synthase [Bacteroides salyersiae]MBV4204313.1 cardiolipin synthase [Bacteroides salyersiae]MCB6649563.1 cardiolipin synthase [Bacteroides salyersiae]